MKRSSYFFLILRLAFSRRGNNLVTSMFITALSLLPLVVTMEIADGMSKGIIARYLETSTYHFRVSPMAGVFPNDQEIDLVTKILKQQNDVVSVAQEQQSFAMIFSSFGREGVMLRGLDSNFYNNDSGMQKFLHFSEGSPVLDVNGLALGQALAKKLNLVVGDTVRILTVSPQGYKLRIRRFIVKGIFSVGYHELDKSWVLLDNRADVFKDQKQNTQFFFGVKVRSPFLHVEEQADFLQALLPDSWMVRDWYDMNYVLIDNFRTTTLLLVFVLGLIVCVAIINNTGALYNFFLSKRKEIALLKAFGSSPRDIKTIFLGFGFISGLVGAILGVVVGSIIAVNIDAIILSLETVSNFFDNLIYHQGGNWGSESFYLEKTQITLHYFRLLLVVVFVVFWSTLVNYFPARKIAKSKVLSILRKI